MEKISIFNVIIELRPTCSLPTLKSFRFNSTSVSSARAFSTSWICFCILRCVASLSNWRARNACRCNSSCRQHPTVLGDYETSRSLPYLAHDLSDESALRLVLLMDLVAQSTVFLEHRLLRSVRDRVLSVQIISDFGGKMFVLRQHGLHCRCK